VPSTAPLLTRKRVFRLTQDDNGGAFIEDFTPA
jgi:hypothetical protein